MERENLLPMPLEQVRPVPAGGAGRGGSGPLLALRHITKAFPGVVANDQVSLVVRGGEIHALLGENGAGKTTLMNILYGILQPDTGQIEVDGHVARIRSPAHAISLGIGMVPQHFLLVRRHTVAENIALALPLLPFVFPTRPVEQRVREVGEHYGLRVDPHTPIWQLSVSEQQRVEILRAVLRGARILILDEPTSVLTPQEADFLFAVLRKMKADGHAVIFITHKLDEVFAVADRVTVLRKGHVIGTVDIASADKRSLARMMVGRDVDFGLPPRVPAAVDDVLSVEALWVPGDRGAPAVRGVSFTVHRGEIFGIAGVAGNGQRELIEALTGLRVPLRGRVTFLGRDTTTQSAQVIHAVGLAHIPEERIRMGIVGSMTVAENLILRQYQNPPFARGPLLDYQAATQFARRLIAEYDIVAPGPQAMAKQLSGGNIQRLILARELSARPALIVAAHPTYGLDIGATDQIHRLLLRRREDGASVLLVSEDLDEILALSDRVGVMFGGELGAIVPAATDRETIGLMMAGHTA
jgi:simple sugar transport system ATP-binding protein